MCVRNIEGRERREEGVGGERERRKKETECLREKRRKGEIQKGERMFKRMKE